VSLPEIKPLRQRECGLFFIATADTVSVAYKQGGKGQHPCAENTYKMNWCRCGQTLDFPYIRHSFLLFALFRSSSINFADLFKKYPKKVNEKTFLLLNIRHILIV
jgi:hypothetical protein